MLYQLGHKAPTAQKALCCKLIFKKLKAWGDFFGRKNTRAYFKNRAKRQEGSG
jgi:hypothetical protein